VAGIVIVGSIIVGGIQYSSAGSDPQKVQAAKNRIKGAVIALLLFLFGYSLLNFLVPGGVL
jgi:archaellum component FlaF (FlaF/FlaG flagellin family)